jgi:Flp pilus assembly protein TadD, contains TPR repeats
MLSIGSSSVRLLIDRKKFPISIEADNPFVASQAFELLPGKQGALVISSREHRTGLKHDEEINIFNNQQIESSKIRIKRIPNSAALMNNLGISYLNSGDFVNAVRCFEESLAIDSNSFQTLANIAKAYLSIGDTRKALDIYYRIEKDDPSNVKVLNNIASMLFRINKYGQAKDYLERVLKQDAKNLAALSNMAMILLLEKQPNKAINLYRQALSVKSDLPGVLNNIGVCFAIQKNFKKAIRHFLAAHNLKKKDVGILVNLASCYYEKGDFDESIRTLENYLKDGEDSQHVRETLARLNFLRKDYKNSLNHLTAALKLFASEPKKDEDKARILNNISVVYEALGDYETAEKYYVLCLDIKPLPSPLALCNAINLYFIMDKDEAAKKLIDKGLIDFPENQFIKESLGRYYFEMKDYKKAYEILTDAISAEPKVENAYALLSLIEMEINKNLKKAHEILKNGLTYHPDSSALLNNLAYNYLLQDDKEQARKILDSIKGRDEVFVLATRGLLLIKEDNIQEGQRLYNLAKSSAISKVSQLPNLIEQKKNLEVAKYYQRKGNFKETLRLLRKVLSVKAKHDYYSDEAEQLMRKYL